MKPSALLAAAAALAFAVPAFAQSQAPQGAPPADGAGRHGGHGDWAAKAQAMRQQRMQDLHIVLRIRPEQEAAFQAFATSMTPERGEHEHGDRGDHAGMATETTPQVIDQMAARQAKREQRMAQHADATKRFYAALSPEQQQVFDALRRLSHEGRGHRGFGGHGFGHGPMGGPHAG